MAEHQKTRQKKQEEGDQKQRTRQKHYEPLFDQFHAWEQGISAINETPFQPRMDEHAKLLADARSDTQRANLVIHLQRTYGNRYVQRLLNSRAVQAKLTVSQPDDVYEQEADRVASIVTQKISADEVQRQVPEEEEEEIEMKASELQRQVPEEEEEVQMQPGNNQPRTIPENLEKRINAARLNGKPMSESVRASFEPQFGVDFSNVRIHDNAEADNLSQQLEAKAFTTGHDIFFKNGEYSPGSSSGQHLLAHELTHVVQQSGKTAFPSGDGFEPEMAKTDIARATGGKIQRLIRYPLDPTKPKGYDEDKPNKIDIDSLSYDELHKYRGFYNEEKAQPGAYPSITWEDGDIGKIDKLIDLKEKTEATVLCGESEVKTALPWQELNFGSVSTCLTFTLEMDDGTRIGAHEGLQLGVPGGAIPRLIQEAGAKKIKQVIVNGILDSWFWSNASQLVLGIVAARPAGYKMIYDTQAAFKGWLGGQFGGVTANIDGPLTDTRTVRRPASKWNRFKKWFGKLFHGG